MSKTFGQSLVGAPVGENKITDIITQLVNWFDEAAKTDDIATTNNRREKLKEILGWLLIIDPKNSQLKSQLEAIK
jgi:hypothetical protein